MSDSASEPALRLVPATVHGRTLVRPPRPAGGACWLVGFHGYAQNAAIFLEPLTRSAPGPDWLVASVQALHPFYTPRTNEVVANWMTRQDREAAIADNVAYIDAVIDTLAVEFAPPRALVFAGFSQGVAMAYRAGVRGRHRCAAIIASGGDVPPELELETGRRWPAVLAATGTADGYYTPAALERDVTFLRTVSPEVRPLAFEGGHEWSETLAAAARERLATLAAAAR